MCTRSLSKKSAAKRNLASVFCHRPLTGRRIAECDILALSNLILITELSINYDLFGHKILKETNFALIGGNRRLISTSSLHRRTWLFAVSPTGYLFQLDFLHSVRNSRSAATN